MNRNVDSENRNETTSSENRNEDIEIGNEELSNYNGT